MTQSEIKELKKQVEESGEYLEPKKEIVGGRFYFFFINKAKTLDSMWIDCKDQEELEFINNVYFNG